MPNMLTPNHEKLVMTLPKMAITIRPRCPMYRAPARVKDDCAPKDNEKSAIFLRIPAPKSAPGLIGPNTT